MSVITVSTPFNIDLEFRIAAFHKRLLAWFIDILLVYLYIFLMNRFVVRPLAFFQDMAEAPRILFLFIPAYCYHLVFEVFMNGQSPGKLALGIKVMDLTGREASLSQYLLRWSFRLFDMLLTFGAAAVLSAALSKKSQRLGDMLAGTVVIDRRAGTGIHDTIYLEVTDVTAYTPVFQEVMNLSDRDINGIRNLLDTRGTSHDTEIYMATVAHRIKEVLNIQSDLTPRELLEQLLKDYNYLTSR